MERSVAPLPASAGAGTGLSGRFAAFVAERHPFALALAVAAFETVCPADPGRDKGAIEHYRRVLEAARAAGVEPWVCLHHFTLPGWFGDDLGGFLDEKSARYWWPRHVDFISETFGDLVFGWKPINEPVAYALTSFLMGEFPPGRTSLDDFHTVDGAMAEDLVKWDSVGFKGIDANLNPQTVSIKEIDVNNAYARLVIETNKTINLLNALRMTLAAVCLVAVFWRHLFRIDRATFMAGLVTGAFLWAGYEFQPARDGFAAEHIIRAGTRFGFDVEAPAA